MAGRPSARPTLQWARAGDISQDLPGWRFPNGGTPIAEDWRVYFMENHIFIILKWMIEMGTPISGCFVPVGTSTLQKMELFWGTPW